MEAFNDLSTCRQIGMGGAGPIPYDAILRWVSYWGVEQPEMFIAVIQSADQVYLETVNKDSKDG